MKQLSKKEILALPLCELGINAVSRWVRWLKRLDSDGRGQSLLRVETVHDLILAFPYRFVGKGGISKQSAVKLKKRIAEMGLTPDDWPALVHHDRLLECLSRKSVIMTLPIREIIPPMRRDYELYSLLGCSEGEELSTKTVRDLIKIDPRKHLDNARNLNAKYEDRCIGKGFRNHIHQFVAIRQQLWKKGFGVKDGPFLRWNPEEESFQKAMEVLEKYHLQSSTANMVARIAVAERWVV